MKSAVEHELGVIGPARAAVRFRPAAVLIGLLLAGMLAQSSCARRGEGGTAAQAGKGAKEAQAAPVSVEMAYRKTIPDELETFGTVAADSTVQVQSQVSEILNQVHFEPGQMVKAGQPLFTLDTRLIAASLKQAQANLARDTVQWQDALVKAGRMKTLLDKEMASPEDAGTAQATAASLAAATQADDAAITMAAVQLERCVITAPITGRAGDILVRPGNLVQANTAPLVVLTKVQPVRVYFSLPSRQLPQKPHTLVNKNLAVRAAIPQALTQPEFGTLTFVDNVINQSTGQIQLAGTFPNDNNRLIPGQYVNPVVLTLGVRADAVVVSSRAVIQGRDGPYVIVVSDDMTAKVRQVKTGPASGELTVIDSNLAPGERVVTKGHSRVADGSKVKIEAPSAPATGPDARPPDGRPDKWTRGNWQCEGRVMNLAAMFIRRPIMTSLVMIALLVFGIVAYFKLPVSDLPNVDYPTINVNASLSGANPETMASAVAMPLEKEFSTIDGLDSMNSTNTQGNTEITIQFRLTRNMDAAALDVQAAISRALAKLPAMPTPPYYRKVNPADQPILRAHPGDVPDLDENAQTLMAQKISTIDGVAQVRVFGSQKYAVRIQVDPRELASRGIGIDQVNQAIQNTNSNQPIGLLNGPYQAMTIQDNGQRLKAAEYAPVIVAKTAAGQAVRLSEVGRAIDSVENNMIAAWFYTRNSADRSIILAIQRQPGTNTVEVAKAIKDLLPDFRKQLPADVSLSVLIDRSLTIEESARDVQLTLLLTLCLVIMVIFLFLRNLSATIIPSLTLPMSIVGTFVVMYLMGYSMDNLSLMALTLSVGFVVDDAIVMLENIVRHMEMGQERMAAAFEGSAEIGFTIVSMTLSLAAVFIPVLFMGGLIGRLFREFSVTIGAAVLVSGVVSLTLTPMLSSRFLRDPRTIHHGRIYQATEAVFNGMMNFYGWTLRAVLGHRRLTMLFSAGILVLTVYMFTIIPMDFIPSEDRDQLMVGTEAGQEISFEGMKDRQSKLAQIIQADPDVDRFISSVGAGGPNRAGNLGRFMIMLKPHGQRQSNADQVMARLRPKLGTVAGIQARVQNPPVINVTPRPSKSLYQLTLQGYDTKELYKFAEELETRLGNSQEFPELRDIATDMQIKNPQLNLDYDRDEAFLLDVSPASIQDALSSAFATRQITTIYAPLNQYQVILELLPEFQRDESVMSMLYVHSTKGQLVPLKEVANVTKSIGPMMINHSGQMQSVTLSFNLQPGVALGQAIDHITAATRGQIPAGITTNFQGAAQVFKDSVSSMGWLLLVAIFVIYVVLGILYENLYHPITILSALPFAGVGALLTLWLFGAPLSIYAFVGIIMLIGLVKKNGIMMVDFAISAQRDEGKNAADAIYEACMIRFRPIMMTTMAALMGGLPIALGWGAGAESRRPLGLAVVGGLLFSQTLTLFVTPVFYVYMEKLQQAIRRRLGSADPAQDGQEQVAPGLAGLRLGVPEK